MRIHDRYGNITHSVFHRLRNEATLFWESKSGLTTFIYKYLLTLLFKKDFVNKPDTWNFYDLFNKNID
ncbi:hypothetical protein, partial [Klebsiella pneumoniae]|uniref:hypothetical protein n=1 Tax=Klebsiella pneumoniae TaxID=573 RepID=UPI0040556B89